jgi:hypothetical protein
MSDHLNNQREQEGAIAPASRRAIVAGDSPVSDYLTTHGIGMGGTFFKFDGKDNKFVKSIDDEEIPEGSEFVVIYDQIQAGWVKFAGKGVKPERRQGCIFDGFKPPPRDTLGDDDKSFWEEGLNGQPQDPWQLQILLPLLSTKEDGELLVFQTSNTTGRRACDNLIRMCARMQKKEPDDYPVIKLRVGGYEHKDSRVGWVKTPAFERVGKAPKANAEMANTSREDDFSDEIPFN